MFKLIFMNSNGLFLLFLFFGIFSEKDPLFFFPVLTEKMEVRTIDRWGSGGYLVARDGGKRKHLGLDIRAKRGTILLSPIGGKLKKSVIPYGESDRFSGTVIEGTGPWKGYEVQIYYLDAYPLLKIKAGEPIGIVQDLTTKFSGIQNHVHIEVRKNGRLMNPKKLFKPYL